MLDNFSKKQKIILLILSIFVVSELVFFIVSNMSMSPDEVEPDDTDEITESTTTEVEEEVPEISTEVPEDAVETEAQKSISIKDESGEDTGVKTGVYNMSATADGFSPGELVVNEGDTVEIHFTPEGEKIDFSIPAYGVVLSPEEGMTEQLSFQASASGTFRIECDKFCPSSGEIVGRFIVRPSE